MSLLQMICRNVYHHSRHDALIAQNDSASFRRVAWNVPYIPFKQNENNRRSISSRVPDFRCVYIEQERTIHVIHILTEHSALRLSKFADDMPVYKLYYFNSRGWAEVSRLMFKVAEVDFEDIRLTREEWPNRKTEMPLQQMPVLEIDGKKYGQSRAVARYLAKTFGLMGSSALDELRINELIDTFQELAIKHVVKVVLEADEEKKKELLGAFIKDNLLIYLDFFEKRLKENNGGNGYFVGNSLTLADLDVYAMMYQMETVFTRIGFSDTFNRPLLKQHYKRVEAVPQIAKWIKERPVTDM